MSTAELQAFHPDIEEFVVVWFVATQEWVAVLPSGLSIAGHFGAVGYAVAAAMEYLGRGEAEFCVTEDSGNFYRYEKCAEFWREAASPKGVGD